ncbi:MAG: NADH-quinone oxidoreductase subunit M [Thaumarchaeota archaeon]|nr:NADH-quinone oxidoreductase subunit M [Nitrososphaerota archaeon]
MAEFPLISIMIFLPIIAGIVTYPIGRASKSSTKWFALVIAVVELALGLFAYSQILVNGTGAKYNFVEGPAPWIPALKGVDYYLGMDGLSGPLVLISSFLTVLVILGSRDLITEKQGMYYALILLFEGFIMGVFTSLNMVLFYAFWDIVLLPMFFFIGVWGGPRRKYAAMKFLLFTFVGSVFMLLGFIAIYILTPQNTFNIPELVGKIPLSLQPLLALLFFIGFGVKLPLVPFHTWLPDAHVEAPAPISVFLAGLLLKMGGYGFLRFNLGLLPQASVDFGWAFIAVGIVTMFYGAIVAMVQKDIKKMIALTSINHMGFVLVGAFSGTVVGISGAIFQMFTHAAAVGVMFMLSGYLHELTGTRDVTVIKGLKITSPRFAALIILGSMAAMGVPMFSSFLAEYLVILGAISVDLRYGIIVLIPVITVAYFLWMMRRTVMSAPIEGAKHHDLGTLSTISLLAYLVPLIATLIVPWLILGMADPLSESLVKVIAAR